MLLYVAHLEFLYSKIRRSNSHLRRAAYMAALLFFMIQCAHASYMVHDGNDYQPKGLVGCLIVVRKQSLCMSGGLPVFCSLRRRVWSANPLNRRLLLSAAVKIGKKAEGYIRVSMVCARCTRISGTAISHITSLYADITARRRWPEPMIERSSAQLVFIFNIVIIYLCILHHKLYCADTSEKTRRVFSVV